MLTNKQERSRQDFEDRIKTNPEFFSQKEEELVPNQISGVDFGNKSLCCWYVKEQDEIRIGLFEDNQLKYSEKFSLLRHGKIVSEKDPEKVIQEFESLIGKK